MASGEKCLTGAHARDTKVHFIHAGDWVRMYVNGKLVEEGHSIPVDEVARLILGQGCVTEDFPEVEDGEEYYDYCAEWEANQA